MKVDYRKSCMVMRTTADGLDYNVIFYGKTEKEIGGVIIKKPPVDYGRLSVGGRQPGNPIELEKPKQFFNRRID